MKGVTEYITENIFDVDNEEDPRFEKFIGLDVGFNTQIISYKNGVVEIGGDSYSSFNTKWNNIVPELSEYGFVREIFSKKSLTFHSLTKVKDFRGKRFRSLATISLGNRYSLYVDNAKFFGENITMDCPGIFKNLELVANNGINIHMIDCLNKSTINNISISAPRIYLMKGYINNPIDIILNKRGNFDLIEELGLNKYFKINEKNLILISLIDIVFDAKYIKNDKKFTVSFSKSPRLKYIPKNEIFDLGNGWKMTVYNSQHQRITNLEDYFKDS